MTFLPRTLALAGLVLAPVLSAAAPAANGPVQLGPRPFFLVDDMGEGALKSELQQCARRGRFTARDFSIGHRGAALQFPEHTAESYVAAARMGAGIVECDVTFTKDKELVCRHAQNDLHTTTNILVTPLAAKCTQPFTPATLRRRRQAARRRPRPSAAPATSRWPSSRRCAARWTRPTRARARRRSTWAAPRTSAPTCTRARPAARC